MRILILREWNILPYFVTFSTMQNKGVGGTEFQLLQHAKALRDLGHKVTILGVIKNDITEDGVFFQGSNSKEHIIELLKQHHIGTDIIFVNITEDVLLIREIMPKTSIVQVCQNGPHFNNDKFIDIYAFVGYGQFAYYCSAYKKYRHKFMLLPSAPPWHSLYSKMKPVLQENQIIWVGSVNKQGLRRWAKAMHKVMMEDKNIKWIICGPSYDQLFDKNPPDAFVGIQLPFDRIEFKNLSLSDLAVEIKRSKIVLASLGGEDGPVSYLDGHALGVPVLCGDDIYGKYYNPEGTGLRCTTVSECVQAIEYLLKNPEVCKIMGEMGESWVRNNLNEHHQQSYIEQILSYISLKSKHALPEKNSIQSDKKFSLKYWLERAEIKYLKYFSQ